MWALQINLNNELFAGIRSQLLVWGVFEESIYYQNSILGYDPHYQFLKHEINKLTIKIYTNIGSFSRILVIFRITLSSSFKKKLEVKKIEEF